MDWLCFCWIRLTSQPKIPKIPNETQKKHDFMLAIERQRRILDLLNAAGSLRTTETSEALGVTDETVRKDFE
jgi:hypothetical protein